MTDAPLLIVGASMAGLRTAEGARRAGYAGPITFLGAEAHAPYNRPPLSKELLQTEGQGHADVAFPIRSALEEGVEWVLGRAATALDVEQRVVVDETGQEHPYRALVIATGLRPKPLPIETHGLGGIHVLRTLDDAVALRAALRPGANVVILGSGFVGCEIAATAAKNGANVSIVSQSRVPLQRALGAQLGAEMRRRHEAHGVRFFCGESLFGLVGEPDVERVILTSGVMLECDVLVVAIGSDPNTEWLQGSGLDATDGVLVDAGLRAIGVDGTVHPEIVAVGDVARYANPLFDDVPRRVEHWNLPTETGKRAGAILAAQLAGQDCAPLVAEGFAPLPSFWSDQYDAHVLAFGMTYLADRSELVAGALDDECVLEYYRGDELVGVCGIGMRSLVQSYRTRFAAPARA
ncbi:NAD(P)/FAD-dependent oxidoreductase [Microcella frigidaquae]|uniref:NADPH-dependent 2,4-dienoyl-CoA reductase/sulfur reductase-like enzyme n=1 Tax=Microcella frigidaquae TaxID=424758 RepID=A0A840X876_9MICO|nr:FAD-dependent oxidoreductase [Microcella frigidaquae]MBB5617404.1 NADPH-dependent 2,4-dienoyl-CoA reductase/sulfur reductase-like enzyme [Microcella frigidaquae]NHN45581.1 FAD-dependent oxidoreductase [Microcella frigidaquae]